MSISLLLTIREHCILTHLIICLKINFRFLTFLFSTELFYICKILFEYYRVSGDSSTKKKIKYPSHFLNKLEQFSFLNEREIFKILFDTKSFDIYFSKVSPFTSIQQLSFFTSPSKTFSNVSFLEFSFLVQPFPLNRQYR